MNDTLLARSYKHKKNNSNSDLKKEFMAEFPQVSLVPDEKKSALISLGGRIYSLVMCNSDKLSVRQWHPDAAGAFAYDVRTGETWYAPAGKMQIGKPTRCNARGEPRFQATGPELGRCQRVTPTLIKRLAKSVTFNG